MRKSEVHTIQKVTLEIFTISTESGKYMERTATDYFWERIVPLLEKYLEDLTGKLEDQTLEIPTLALEFTIDPTNLPDGLDLEVAMRPAMQVLRSELHSFLLSSGTQSTANSGPAFGLEATTNRQPFLAEKSEMRLRQDSEKLGEAWIYFLRSGFLPWWCDRLAAAEAFLPPLLVTKLLGSATIKESFRSLLAEASVRERLFKYYTGSELVQILETILREGLPLHRDTFRILLQTPSLPERKARMELLAALFFHHNRRQAEAIAVLREYLAVTSPDFRRRIEDELSKSIESGKSAEPRSIWSGFLKDLRNVSGNTVTKRTNEPIAPDMQERVISDPVLEEEQQYVDRAGLILVHPFLPAFFTDCGFLDDKGKLVRAELAVKAVHYLATRRERPFDFELVFEKFLCGIPLTSPLSRETILSDSVKNKSEKLLESLIDHWKKLKNTGAETVRNEFLNRSGKLVIEETSDRLYVERKPQDVLLESLPWNLSLVKLPWQRKVIVVSW
ncbi:hypothetical protein SAMN05192553_101534 [Cyclobacterium xiamenense]|uniref:Uncharacterized protein n=1 Tax=Cyclobacterium xiamenense TaxID=1297121 RepID=A0A1H6UB59_9BACT|nr:contractile injection system tape measure protein [Cyclobacterium xiamenense]SEI85082.1 hypothetical protein SAMN05192553_101534 [Cyclobacterium xiamenense]